MLINQFTKSIDELFFKCFLIVRIIEKSMIL